jgi:hypothetical protein
VEYDPSTTNHCLATGRITVLTRQRSFIARHFVSCAGGLDSATSEESAIGEAIAAPAFNVLALYSGSFDDAHINQKKEAAVWFSQVAAPSQRLCMIKW